MLSKNRLISSILSLFFSGIIIFGAISVFNSKNGSQIFRVQKIDDNHAKLHCKTSMSNNSEFLLSKTKKSNIYQYDISFFNKSQNHYSFDSPTNIDFDEGMYLNSQLNVGVWLLSKGSTTAGTLATGFSAMGKAKTIAAIGSGTTAIFGAGAISAANGLGWFAGAKLATAVLLTAAGPVTIIAGIGAVGGIA